MGYCVRYGPKFASVLHQIWTEAKVMNVDVDWYGELTVQAIQKSMPILAHSTLSIQEMYDKKFLNSLEVLVTVKDLLKMAYMYDDGWYILINGVVFEGVREQETKSLLDQIFERLPEYSPVALIAEEQLT